MVPNLPSDTEAFCRITKGEVQGVAATWEVSLRKKEVALMRIGGWLRPFDNPFISRLLIFLKYSFIL